MSDTFYERQRAQQLPVFGLPQPLRIEPVELHQADLSNLSLCDKTTRDSQLQQTSLSTSDPPKACAPFATQSLRVNFLEVFGVAIMGMVSKKPGGSRSYCCTASKDFSAKPSLTIQMTFRESLCGRFNF